MKGWKSGFERKGREARNRGESSYEKGNMQAVFWNVRGIGGLDKDDWKKLMEHDIINLTETWIQRDKDSQIERRLRKYEVRRINAKKEKKKGRPKGGMATAYRNNLQHGKIKTEKIKQRANENRPRN